jgi:hypothetical protein
VSFVAAESQEEIKGCMFQAIMFLLRLCTDVEKPTATLGIFEMSSASSAHFEQNIQHSCSPNEDFPTSGIP